MKGIVSVTKPNRFLIVTSGPKEAKLLEDFKTLVNCSINPNKNIIHKSHDDEVFISKLGILRFIRELVIAKFISVDEITKELTIDSL